MAGAGFGMAIIILIICAIAMAIGFFVFWIWMIIDCANNEPNEGNDKVLWIVIIILLGWIGALVYFFGRRPKRKELYGK